MGLLSITKIELYKLRKKRTTLLLLLLFVPAVLFGIGMSVGLPFLVSDGEGGSIDAVGGSLSGLGFAVNMIQQSEFVLFLVVIILSAISFAGELENGQLKSETIRVCHRGKILAAKYFALMGTILVSLILCVFWSLLIYAVLPMGNQFKSGLLYDGQAMRELLYLLFTAVSIAVVIAFTLALGTLLKMFPCFAVSYILWFVSLYTDFMGNLKYYIPYNLPGNILGNAYDADKIVPYAILYMSYVLALLGIAHTIFRKRDIKT